MPKYLKSATAILAIFATLASISKAETLADALSIAYETNPTIRAERARLRATQETKAQAWAGALPQINGEGNYSKTDTTQTAVFDASGPQTTERQLDSITAGVTAEQPVFAGFRNINAIRQAKARIRAGGAQLISVEQQVLANVASAYFDVQRNMTLYELRQKNVDVLRQQNEMATVRFEVGEITRTDVAQADARLAQARAQLSNAQGSLAVSRATYAQLVGQTPGDLEPVEQMPELPENIEAALTLARQYSPSVIGAQENAEAARRQINIARGALLPSVSLTSSYQYADEPSFFVLESETFAYGARVRVPIFSGGANLSRIREAKALYASSRAQLVEAERQVEAQVTAAWQALYAARAVIISSRSAVEANTLALEGVTQEALVGTRTTLDVLNAEQELLNSEVSLVNAERDAQSAAFDLLSAVGILTPQAIGVEANGDNAALQIYPR